MANNSILTDLSTSPYFDDYDEEKGYYRVLFKPAVGVQVREINQLQQMLQKQIDRFGEHIFKEGSLVSGGAMNYDQEYYFIKIKDTDNFSNDVSVGDYLGKSLTGETNGVKAIVVNAINGEEIEAPDTKTLYIKYLSSGTNANTSTFIPSESISANSGLSVDILAANTSIGVGSAVTFDEGVVFARDHFIKFPKQTIVLSKYSQYPSCVVGFKVTETIVTFEDDSTLLDNANGTLNYTAPGADRLKLELSLVKYDTGEEIDDNFIELVTLQNGVIQEKYTKAQYSIIKEEFARRTYDESGNYIVSGMGVRVREHLDDGTNNGLYKLVDGGDSDKLVVGINPGKAYIYGYDFENLVTNYAEVDKGVDYQIAEQQVVAANYGNYVVVKEVVGHWPINTVQTVNLYDTAETRITNREFSSTTPSGVLLGTAKLKALQYSGGSNVGTSNAQFYAYLHDIKMTAGSFSQVRAMYSTGTNASLCADIVTEANNAVLKETTFNTDVLPIAISGIRSIRDENGDIDTSYTFMKSYNVSIATNGQVTITTGSSDEIFPYSAGALNNVQKRNNFVLNLNADATVSLTGTVSTTNGANTVSGTGTAFTTQLKVGDKILVSDLSVVKTVTSIANNTSLNVDSNFAADEPSSNFKKQYYSGELIDFSIKGSTNVDRTITAVDSTTVTLDMKETIDSTIAATVTTFLNKVDAREKLKVLRRNRYVLIDCGTHSANTTGPWNLGVPDIFKLTDVRVANSFASVSDGASLLSSFDLDNGQRDSLYDHGSLVRKAGTALSASNKLLVKFDYFEHDLSIGKGYFSVDSYPIDDVNGAANTNAITTKEIPFYQSSTSGISYDLRDSIDIRPSKQLTANSAISLVDITTNPTTTNSFNVAAGGLNYPAPNENFVFDLSYYLSRKDLLTVNNKGMFNVVRGVPAILPVTPNEPAENMTLAVISVAPYPSLPSEIAKAYGRTRYANKINFTGSKRFTMKDIGTLEQRIQNLEYYTSLSLIEKNTLDMKVLDGDGLDRFKNGIIVDQFSSHLVGNGGSPDYSIAIDPLKNELRPKFVIEDLELLLGTTTNVQTTGPLITLPYTHEPLIRQPYSSTTKNAAGLFYKFMGELYLNPESDFWTDTQREPDLVVQDNTALEAWYELADIWGTQWGDWQTNWTGVNTTTSSSSTISGANSITTTIETTTTSQNQSKTGTQLNVSHTTQTQNYGDRVIDTSIAPFMRPRTIKVTIVGVKPSTRLYCFFDNESVDNYVQQTDSSFVPLNTDLIGDLYSNSSPITSETVISDENGNAYLLFYLPANDSIKFTTGTKTFRVTDSPGNSSSLGSVTTSAEASYSAFGMNQVKQSTIVSTAIPHVSANKVSEQRTIVNTSTDTSVRSEVVVTPPVDSRTWWDDDDSNDSTDPIAQSFSINVGTSTGVFMSKADLFFAQKDATFGVTIEIRELDSAGNPTQKVVPFSRVTIPSSAINVSNNSSIATTIPFEAPVYLMNLTDYALVVKPVANNPNTVVWTSRLGETDIITGAKIVSQPYSGVLFVSSNDKTWSAVQDEDLKFILYRAKFDTEVTGQVTFTNKAYDFLAGNTFSGNFDITDELVRGNHKLIINNVAGGTPTVGQKIRGVTSNTAGTIVGITSNTYSVKLNALENFSNNEVINFTYANNTVTGANGSISAISFASAYVARHDRAKNIVHVTNSNGLWETGETVVGQRSNNSFVITGFEDVIVNVFAPQASHLSFSGTQIEWQAKTTSNTYVLDSAYSAIQINDNNTTKTERVIASRKNEIASMSSEKSFNTMAILSTDNDTLSPVIDKTRTHVIAVENIINNDSTGEEAVSGGNALARYLTKQVTLAEGQDAEDLKVYLTAYKPTSTSIKVYFKFLHAEDSDTFAQKSWIEAELTSKEVFSNKENVNDFKEYEYSVPDANLTGSNAEIQYENSAGVTFTGFKNFAVKIVLLSPDTSVIPRVKNMRGLALQK